MQILENPMCIIYVDSWINCCERYDDKNNKNILWLVGVEL